jgi:hypothetical protein
MSLSVFDITSVLILAFFWGLVKQKFLTNTVLYLLSHFICRHRADVQTKNGSEYTTPPYKQTIFLPVKRK